MISGMERAVQDAPNRDCPKGVAVSMSFGNAFSQAVNDAAAAINDKGYFPVVAAGNGNILQIPQDGECSLAPYASTKPVPCCTPR